MLKKLYRHLKWLRQDIFDVPKVKGKQKIFCIGRNKTGTTSIKAALKDLGYVVGYQRRAVLLLDAYIKKDYQAIIKYCKTAEAFQDAPFSYPLLYKILDQAFPGSKFILTIRKNPDTWYNSITKFHTKLFADGKRIPTAEDLKNSHFIEKGWIWKANRTLYSSPESDPYCKENLIQQYNQHNKEVIEYFRGSNRFIVIDISQKDAYFKFCEFLGKEPIYDNFPWENKTTETTKRF